MDNKLYNDLYNSNYKSLFRYFYYKGCSIEESEDLLSDTFVKLFSGYSEVIKSDTPKAKKIAWGIAHNLLVNHIQENIRNRGISLSEMAELEDQEIEPAAEEINVFTENDFDEKLVVLKKRLVNEISHLSPIMNEIVTLKFYKGYTRKMIAEKLNISEDMVHTYQKRAIRYLKKSVQ